MKTVFGRKERKECPLFRNSLPLSPGQNRCLNLFFYATLFGTVAAMLGIILYYVYAFAALHNGDHRFDWLLGIFSDFVEIMNASLKDSPYITNGTSYPPIAVMVLYPFALICQKVFATYSHMSGLTVDELTARVILHKEFWIALLLFFFISIVSVILIVIKRYRLDPKASLRVASLITFAAPFVYAIMRGNTIYFALVFLLLFLLLYKSPRPAVRELAYLCLVLSGSIKIYPLFFGVYLLHKKKFFASIRVGVYFAILFFLSFHFFRTGLDGMDPFVDNLSGFIFSDDRWLSMRNLSISALLYKIFYLLSPALADSVPFMVVNLAVMAVFFLVATVTGIGTRSSFSRALLATSVVVLFPTVSYFYVLTFTLIPFMEFLRSYDCFSPIKQRLYAAGFFFLFFTFFLLPQCFIPHTLIILAMFGTEAYGVIKHELIPFFRARRA